MRRVVLVLALLLVAAPALAVMPPVNGVYLSGEFGGWVLTGHFSESWYGPGSHGQIHNTINAQSWDGIVLGSQWRLWCPEISAPPTLVSDTRDGAGTGEVTWRTTYSGGQFWLTRSAAWSADNAVDFTGTVQSFIITTTYQYVFGQLLGIRSNVTTQGLFDKLDPSWSDLCMDYTIDNAAFYGTTDQGPLPSTFPGFLSYANCPSDIPSLARGGWGDVTHLALRITGCVVPSESTTWGALKARYGN